MISHVCSCGRSESARTSSHEIFDFHMIWQGKSFLVVKFPKATNKRILKAIGAQKNYEFSLRFDDRVIWRRCKPIFASFSFSSSSIFSIIQVSDFFLLPRCFLLALYATFSTTHATNFRQFQREHETSRAAKVLVAFRLRFFFMRQFSDSIWLSRISAHVRRDETEQNINYFN